MRRDSRAFLWDVLDGADAILEFTRDPQFEDYLADRLLRSAVERQFEILGEALSQLAKIAPDLAQRIPDFREVVAFRNVLIHGYAAVDHRTVWEAVQSDVPALRRRVAELLSELGEVP